MPRDARSAELVLASGSPRRLELLASAGFRPLVRPSDVDETPFADERPEPYVARVSRAKVLACESKVDQLVLGADTTVDLGGAILGKPSDEAHALAMLGQLSGTTHRVHTGVAVRCGDLLDGLVVTTEVTFAELSSATMRWYIGTGEPFDKAGGYAIQGSGACLVRSVSGSVSNVIGLPLVETIELLDSCLSGSSQL